MNPVPHVRPRTRSRWLIVGVLSLIALGSAGCGGETESLGTESVITADRFIEGMVALRTAPSLGTALYLPEGEPERILGELGLEPEDLRRFVEVHGEEVPLMAEVWDEIERLVNEARVVRER